MFDTEKALRWAIGLRAGLGIIALVGSTTGCSTVGYYGQAIRGEYRILRERRPIAELITDPSTKPELRQKFELVTRLRTFAQTELKLPVNEHYRTYADVRRRYAVWNVHAAPEFSLEPKKWWYPFVGSLKYRGYFSERAARRYAEGLARHGEDVHVEGVEAFSTLGLFADPLLNTFIHHSEPDLAETLFHELTHQRLFLSGDTDFNEAFATTAAEEGVRRWLLGSGDQWRYQEYLLDLTRNRQVVALVMGARSRLQVLYARNNGIVRTKSAPAWVHDEKARMIAELREDYEKLKSGWGGYSGYERWFAQSLNNAQLNTIALYYELVPGFEVLLERADGDLERFYRSVERLRRLKKEERHRFLQELGRERLIGVRDQSPASTLPEQISRLGLSPD